MGNARAASIQMWEHHQLLSPRGTDQEARGSNARDSLQAAALMRGEQTKRDSRPDPHTSCSRGPSEAHPASTHPAAHRHALTVGPLVLLQEALGGAPKGSRACRPLPAEQPRQLRPWAGSRPSESCPLLRWGSHHRPWCPQVSSSPGRG